MGISIHAPHEGERHKEVIKCVMQLYFNPRSPRGGATEEGRAALASYAFQSTLPTRGSDASAPCEADKDIPFQSTLPTRGSDAHLP